jgi:RNA polymerase sigma-70 factor (ECF subfamily)
MEPLSGEEVHELQPGSEEWSDDAQVFVANGEFKRVLGELRTEERAVLYLSAVENYTAQQIADLLEWPRGTVLSLLHRTRGKLKKRLEAESKKSS